MWESELLFLLFKFKPSLPWADAPFHDAINHPEIQGILEPINSEKLGVLLSVILVSADTGVVEAIRAITLNNEFSKMLYQYIKYQRNHPINRTEYERRIDRLYQKYPTPQAMVSACQFYS